MPWPPLQPTSILHRDISVFDSLEAVYEAPLHGTIVELVILDNAPVERHKTGGPGHWTLVADADTLLEYVDKPVGVV
jgi:hypothetical protein